MVVDAHVGKMVAGYGVDSVISSGSFATVYEVHPPGIERKYAMKIPNVINPESRERMWKEARLLGRASDPHLPEVFWHGVHETPCIVMEKLDETLEDRLKRGPMHWSYALNVGLHILDGLWYAHHTLKVIHRDVKPKNVMFKGKLVKLIDFNLAQECVPQGVDCSVSKDVPLREVGTRLYAAPEQLGFLKEEVTDRSDLYAVGSIIYQMITGTVPYGWTRPLTEYGAPIWLDEVVRKARAHLPRDRFDSAHAMSNALLAGAKSTLCAEIEKFLRQFPEPEGLQRVESDEVVNLQSQIDYLRADLEGTRVKAHEDLRYAKKETKDVQDELEQQKRKGHFLSQECDGYQRSVSEWKVAAGALAVVGLMGWTAWIDSRDSYRETERQRACLAQEAARFPGKIAYVTQNKDGFPLINVVYGKRRFDANDGERFTLPAMDIAELAWSCDGKSVYVLEDRSRGAMYDVRYEYAIHKVVLGEKPKLIFDSVKADAKGKLSDMREDLAGELYFRHTNGQGPEGSSHWYAIANGRVREAGMPQQVAPGLSVSSQSGLVFFDGWTDRPLKEPLMVGRGKAPAYCRQE